MDGACLAVGAIAKGEFFQGGEETWAETGLDEDLAEVGWSVEVESGFFLQTVL